MQPTSSEPYITAVLTGTQTELDLSGQQPFNLSISLTLHAKAPIICYIDPEDTFFIRRNALHQVGIRFRDQRTNIIQQRTERACTGFMKSPNLERPLAEWSRLYLSPGKPVLFEVAFPVTKTGDADTAFIQASTWPQASSRLVAPMKPPFQPTARYLGGGGRDSGRPRDKDKTTLRPSLC
ncbi:hypothetical protein KCU65_g5557, partial [Aureobasidium melanogenum]